MIYFEVEGGGYSVSAADLSGVASDCPFTSYSLLPHGFCGITQWSGKIFPVIDIRESVVVGAAQQSSAFQKSSFLFLMEGVGELKEVALAVPGKVEVFVAVLEKDGFVYDAEGRKAKKLELRTIVQDLLKRERQNAA